MSEPAVVIAGGGPTGLMLAAELALAGVDDVVVVERPGAQPAVQRRSRARRAGAMAPLSAHPARSLDQRSVRGWHFVAAGTSISPTLSFAGVPLDISDFPTRHPYVLALWQSHFEPILADWVDELGVPILRGREVVGFAQDATGVDVELSDGTSLRAEYLVGCDGARSLVRKAAGIAFPGMDPTTGWMIAEVEMDDEPEFGPRPEGGGIGRASDGSAVRVVLMEREVDHQGDPDLDDLRGALEAAYGTDFGVRDAHWISRFTDMTRQAATYRDRRVLLASATPPHVHPPQGGQGLNTGVQDAVNLGWKLAQVVQGTSPETLLDTYHDERHPVGARVLRNTVVAVALTGPDERQQAVRAAMVELLSMDEPRRSVAANISGLDIRYDLHDDLDAAHPLVGRRMPDLDLDTDDGPTRVFALLPAARPVLVDFGAPGTFDIAPWANRVRRVDATYAGAWKLPVIGGVAAPPAVLIRPDGHVAWVGALTDPALPEVLTTWFGAPNA